ncbi:ArdC-like ssDNA-binding domain-containing protein [Xanthobacter sp. V7C-4]|uniref:ArdC family protein n=1 Tax=Xanthobacter autotrophicus (strain ATCC BAA-1158 / Py2) TaxID=78245 RepID=UPI00372CA450
MSRKTTTARAGQDRASLYDEITDKIIAELEAGRIPWVQPWGTAAAKAPLAMPRNAATGRHYSGINVLILWGAVVEHGFPGQSWLTFRQALALGGNVRKGERGTTVVYADRFVPDDEKRRARETGDEAQAIPFLKRFTVFNAAQCENLPADVSVIAPPPPPGLIEPQVEALIRATGIDFRIGGNRAFYVPALDYVQVPPPQAYFEPINWHRTALHELGHATGQIFWMQLVTSLFVFSLATAWYLLPTLTKLSRNSALEILLFVHVPRYVGMTLLVTDMIDPKLSGEFRSAAAYGDLLEAVLALASIFALRGNWRFAIPMVWVTNLWGFADLLNGLRGVVSLNVPSFNLSTIWYIYTFYAPVVIISHLLIFWILLSKSWKREDL